MKQNEADRLVDNLNLKFGLPMHASLTTGENGQNIFLTPKENHPNESFKVQITIGWRSLHITLIPGKFAADFLEQIANSSVEKKHIFSDVAYKIVAEKAILSLKINETEMDPLSSKDWPVKWKSFSFSLKKSPLEINTENFELTEYLINLWVVRFFGCIIPLFPLEEVEITEDETGYPEGSLSKVFVNRYERNRYNRSICLNFHGSDCKVCGINFGQVYGKVGDGFIHVHHVVPVSKLGTDYVINPVKDLVPVCPNCHAMLHKRNPPFSVSELKKILNPSV